MRLTFALILLTASLFSACSTQSPTGQEVDKAFRPLIWPETKLLAGVDVAKLRKSQLYQQHENEINDILKRTGADRFGLDLRRDVDYLAFSSDGRRSLVFARGNFKNVKKDVLPRDGGTVIFPSDRVALAGDAESVSSARALEQKGSGEVPEELAARLHSLDRKDQIWVVSRGPLPLDNLSMRNDTRSNLGNFVGLINGLTVGLAAEDGLHLAARVSSATPEGATRIHDAFRGMIGLARLSTKDNETDMLKIYDAFEIKKNGNAVEVNAALPGSETNRLLQRLPR